MNSFGLKKIAIALSLVGLCATSAFAVGVNATVTADNHYGLYYGSKDGTSMTFVGRNELDASGAPGTFNWSEPENFAFDVPDGQYIYVAGWSDNAFAQAWLGQFVTPTETIVSDTGWEVYLTFQDLGDGSPAPTAGALGSQVNFADTNGLWVPVSIVRANGSAPWGLVAGVSNSAYWAWGSAMEPGSSYGEYQIFRHSVPEPTTMLLLGSSLLGFAGVRRKKA